MELLSGLVGLPQYCKEEEDEDEDEEEEEEEEEEDVLRRFLKHSE